jgi:hypothetical protein
MASPAVLNVPDCPDRLDMSQRVLVRVVLHVGRAV